MASGGRYRRALAEFPGWVIRTVRGITWSDALPVAAILLVIYAGFFKATPVLSWMPVDATAIATVLLGALVVIRVAQRPRAYLTWRNLAVLVVLAAAIVPALLIASDRSPYEISKLVGLAVTLTVGAGAYVLLRSVRRQQYWVYGMIVVGAMLMFFLTIFPNRTERSGGLMLEGSNIISTGQVAGAAFVVVFILALTSEGKNRLVAAVGVLGFGWLVLASGSRGVLVAVVVALTAALVLLRTKGRFDKFYLAGAALVAGLGYLVLSGSTGANRLFSFITGAVPATASRDAIWAASWRRIAEHPFSLTGVGWGRFDEVLRPDELLSSGDRQYPHNVFLEVWVEAGFLAVVALVVLVVLSLWKLSRVAASPAGAGLLALAVFSIVNASVSGDINGNRLLWATLAIAWVLAPGIGRSAWPAHPPVILRWPRKSAPAAHEANWQGSSD